jgi:FtsP/CotA-like multicopper oxidase with cupredoxin domain
MSRRVPPPLFGIPLAYGVGLWLVWLHAAEGGHEHNEPPLLLHWLRDSTLALPGVIVAAWLALWLARRMWRTGSISGLLETATTVSLVAIAVSAAFALGTPFHQQLFESHEGHELPLLVHMLRDAVIALAVALPATATVAVVRADLTSPRLRSVRPRPALAGLGVAVVAAATGGAVQASATGAGNPCGNLKPKEFIVYAIDIKIPLNRFGDHDRNGKMYVLEDNLVPARKEEQKLVDFLNDHRSKRDFATPGLRGDAIQPLVIRANEGECVEITFKNRASGTFGIHIDGLVFLDGSSGDAVGGNPHTAIARGEDTTYRWFIPNDPRLEGAHYMSPGPGNRAAVSHGLFGALVVEPPGSVYKDPVVHPGDTRGQLRDLASGEEAIVVPCQTVTCPRRLPSFRDNVTIFHEIGNENDPVFNADGNGVTRVDPTTDAYRPGTRAVNYRSEPFLNRLTPDHRLKSLAYDSYTFGDPATPITRAYLGDPMKIRLLHGGAEMFHVYHLHGGGLRWPFQPQLTHSFYGDTGLDKNPPLYSGLRDGRKDDGGTAAVPSHMLDSQAFGPGESYSFELSGGAGGRQQAVGDFTYHCHIAEHYVAGMWGVRRTFDTLKPDLQPLPDRPFGPGTQLQDAVTSEELYARARAGDLVLPGGVRPPTEPEALKKWLDDWIRPQLPPQAKPFDDQDASVWDWTVDDDASGAPHYLGEPEEQARTDWPNLTEGVDGHPGSFPGDSFVGSRPEILLNPVNGRPTYPLLRPHIRERPPFAPRGHTGAPYLGEAAEAPLTPSTVDPWAQRADGICPADAPLRNFNTVLVPTPVRVTTNPNRFDEHGLIFVLAGAKAGQHPDLTPETAQPLALRANVKDCVEVTLTNEETDAGASNGFAKANLHVHHVQFDPLGSDGAVVGFNYEMAVRPYREADTQNSQLAAAAAAGATTLQLSNVSRFQAGVWIGVGLGTDTLDICQIGSIDKETSTVSLAACRERPPDEAPAVDSSRDRAGLVYAHDAGDWAGTEFVQSRWYVDMALDNVFWHEHVDGIHGWPHGGVGMIIIEPQGSTYHDPYTGAVVKSGTFVDVHTRTADGDPRGRLAPGVVDGDFREVALWMINDNPITDSTINMRAAPFSDRGGDPASRLSSSGGRGDPPTPRVEAYPGDPVVFRLLNVSPNVDTFHVDGHRLFVENRCMNESLASRKCAPEEERTGTGRNDNTGRWVDNVSGRIDTVHIGPSERFTLILDGGAGGQLKQPGDYLYMNGVDRRFRQGAWGIVRVLNQATDLDRLPDRPEPDVEQAIETRCPNAATMPPTFGISAVDLPSSGSGSGDGRKAAYVPTADVAAVKSGAQKLEPLVLHVAASECVKVRFKNERASARASFHVGELLHAADATGIDVGTSDGHTLAPGSEHDYVFFADNPKIGSALISDFGGDSSGKDGLYGAVIVAPAGARFLNPATNAPYPDGPVGTQVKVDCSAVAPSRTCAVDGQEVDSYRDFTLAFSDDDPQLGSDFMPYPVEAREPALVNYLTAPRRDDTGNAFTGIPPTPFLQARVGEAVVVHALGTPGSEQTHVFTLGGMSWPLDPQTDDSPLVSNLALAPWMTVDAAIAKVGPHPQDFFYGDRRRPFAQAGMWGVFRVTP